MKTTLSRIALAALISAGVAHAAPYSGKGLPADTGAVVHVDAEAAANSTLFKAIRETAEKAAAEKAGTDNKQWEALKTELGITDKSVTDVTVSISAPGNAAEKEPLVAAHLHGKFDQAKLLAIPKNHPEVKAKKSGAYTYFTASDLDKAFGDKTKPAKSDEKAENAVICPVDASTVIFASDVATLEKNLKAVSSKSAYNTAETKSTFAGKPMIGVCLPESFFAAAKKQAAPGEPSPKSAVVTAGETGGNFAVHVGVKMDSAESAQQSFAQLQGMLGFLPMMLSQQKPDATAQQKADQQFFLSLFSALKVTNTGDSINADFAYSAEKLAAKFREKQDDIAKFAEQTAMSTASATGAGTSAPKPAPRRSSERGGKTK